MGLLELQAPKDRLQGQFRNFGYLHHVPAGSAGFDVILHTKLRVAAGVLDREYPQILHRLVEPGIRCFMLRLSQNFSFWKSNLGFMLSEIFLSFAVNKFTACPLRQYILYST
jgi:hypothetical protein